MSRSRRASDPLVARCAADIYNRGVTVCTITGETPAIEAWVQHIARAADAKVDWHRLGGYAVIKCLGNADTVLRVKRAITKHPWKQ